MRIVKSSSSSQTSHVALEPGTDVVVTACGEKLKVSTSFTSATFGQVTCVGCINALRR